ncbi:MAG: DUF2085 domain-containing protein [Thermoflexales bacterium]|nr:DUF2085 domain-containing protein [Thermoflexales bacterium]
MANKLANFFARHWLAAINVWLAVYVGLPLLAPVLMANGLEWPAAIIYKLYLFLCHELPHRSYFLFGPQAVYSLQELVDAAGVDALWGYPVGGAYREFTGNAQMGFKVSLCQRDMAIYSTMLLSGLVFSVLRRRVKPIPVWVYIALGLVPIGLDGVSQLISYIVPSLMPGGVPRESSWILRTITGALFGWATMALALPYLHESFTAMEEQLAEPDA